MVINIDELTYGDIKTIAALAGLAGKKRASESVTPRKVIVRSYGAGVFFGTLVAKKGQEVTLTDCRRIWNWKGANTCSELALTGLTPQGSRVAQPTPRHVVLEVIEIIDCSDGAVATLEAAKWAP